MKQSVLTLFFLLLGFYTQAQNFDQVDIRVKQYPSSYASAESLAAQIAGDFKTEATRTRALFTWLATNVSYDLETYYGGNTQINFSYTDQEDLERKLAAINTNTVNKTLRTKMAICEGYAQTFKTVSELMGIKSVLVGGYSKGDAGDIGVIPAQENHAWNAVKIDKKWYLLDATWAAGVSIGNRWEAKFNDFFFLTDPKRFALTHYPSEPTWFLTDDKRTLKEFYNSPVFENGYFSTSLDLLSPMQGMIYARPDSKIKIQISQPGADSSLYYAYTYSRYPQKINPYCSSGKCSFEIPAPERSNAELVIFANKRPAIQYKVKLVN